MPIEIKQLQIKGLIVGPNPAEQGSRMQTDQFNRLKASIVEECLEKMKYYFEKINDR